jgi:hypothetical protein
MNTLPPEIIGLIGVAIGGLISLLTGVVTSLKEYKFRITEKLVDKRISAHEDIMSIAQQLRTSVSSDRLDSDGYFATYPIIFHNKETFDDYRFDFHGLYNPNIHWLGSKVNKELNYIQDYIENLAVICANVPSEKYPQIGLLVKHDIIEMAQNLQELTMLFFQKSAGSFKSEKKAHHKYPQTETLNRLYNSQFWKHKDQIEQLK